MKQLLQNLRTGAFSLEECPVPARPSGFALVATRASLISAGTERSTVMAAQASLLGKARQRPDKVRQVLDNLKKEGVLATIQKVRDKLDQPKALGYSSAGVVIEADPGETRFRAGDRVACGGGEYAVHAEVVIVPRNLVVPLPDRLSFEEGAFATIGAVALQGVRRAGVQLGDRVLVIGLGLIGQLTWQLLADAGCTVIGTDISEPAVERARALGLAHALVSGRDDVAGACTALTAGQGVDAVLVTAAAHSREPLELAGSVCRERGRVVVVGNVPIEVPRELYYRRELDVLISRSYGPGRYDREYEEGGVDYPYAHVRWTEGRNIEAFVEAVARGGVKVEPLITHRFPFADAESAYELVSGERREPHVGIVLTYPDDARTASRVELRAIAPEIAPGTVRVGFIGAGSFARTYLLPKLKRDGVELVTVATAKGYTAVDVARKFGFAEASTSADDVLADPRVDAVFIATRHDRHAPFAERALLAGKHVYVEKPLALDRGQLASLAAIAAAAPRVVQVGFNRRFSPLARELRAALATAAGPVHVTYRINAGPLPPEHWLLDPAEGGGRIIGEGCHFVDLAQFLADAPPVRVNASGFGDDATGARTLQLEFANGSTAVIVYQANAAPGVAKEYLEAFAGGKGGIIDDWRSLELFDGRKSRTTKVRGQAKGYAEELDAFFASLRSGTPAIPLDSLVATTSATLAAMESLAARRPIEIAR